MNCPECNVELAPADVHGVEAHRCPSCGGIWLHDQGFDAARAHVDPNLSWLELDLWKQHERFAVEAKGLACPSCGGALYTLRYGETDVAIEHCNVCRGVWFQEEELQRIVAALEAEVATMPTAELLGITVREAGELIHGEKSLIEEWEDVKHVLQLLKLRVLSDSPGLRQILLQFQRGTPFG